MVKYKLKKKVKKYIKKKFKRYFNKKKPFFKNNIVKFPGTHLPAQLMVKLKYTNVISTSLSSVGQYIHLWNLNSAYDPDASSTLTGG